MNGNLDWLTLVVVVGAFIGGYLLLSFIIKTIWPKQPPHEADHPRPSSDGRPASPAPDASDFDSHADWNRRQDRPGGWTQPQPAHSEFESEEQRHARALGLKTPVTISQVKTAYRDMLAKYHPDKVDHLGDDIKLIAQQRTREITAAYQYFCERYDIR